MANSRKLDDWFRVLVFEKLPLSQGIDTEIELASQLLKELTESGFPDFLRAAAEDWILNGNWRYKSPKRLTLQDFYPTEEQLSDRKNFISMDEHLASLKKNEENIRQAAKFEIETKLDILFKKEFSGRKKNSAEYGLQVLESVSKIKELQDKVASQVLEIARLKDKLGKLQQEREDGR